MSRETIDVDLPGTLHAPPMRFRIPHFADHAARYASPVAGDLCWIEWPDAIRSVCRFDGTGWRHFSLA